MKFHFINYKIGDLLKLGTVECSKAHIRFMAIKSYCIALNVFFSYEESGNKNWIKNVIFDTIAIVSPKNLDAFIARIS